MMELLRSEALLLLADLIITLVFLKGTLVLAWFAALAVSGKRSSAALRSSFWTLAFGSLLLLPIAWFAIPWWETGVLNFPRALFSPVGYSLGDSFTAELTRSLVAALPNGVVTAVAGIPVASYIALIWLAGAILILTRFLLERIRVERLARRGQPADAGRCANLISEIRTQLRISRAVRVVYSNHLPTPATFGIFRPVVLLPQEAAEWETARLMAVLYHELAHIQRHDYISLLFIELARALYWINPLIPVAASRARECQDQACDDTVLRSGMTASTYARHLLELARNLSAQLPRRFPQSALPLVTNSRLGRRVRVILDKTSDRTPLTAQSFRRRVVLALLFCGTLASVNLWRCEAAEPGITAPAADLVSSDSDSQPLT